jgi:hypothetical protein
MKKFKDIIFEENTWVWVRTKEQCKELCDYLTHKDKHLIDDTKYSVDKCWASKENSIISARNSMYGGINDLASFCKSQTLLAYEDVVDGDVNLLKTKDGKWIEVKVGDKIIVDVGGEWDEIQPVKEIKDNKLRWSINFYNLSTGQADKYNGNTVYAIDPDKKEEIEYTLKNENGEDVELNIGDTIYVLRNGIFSGDEEDIRKIRKFKDNEIYDNSRTHLPPFENKTGIYTLNSNIKISLFPPKPKLDIDWDMIPDAKYMCIDGDGTAYWFEKEPEFDTDNNIWDDNENEDYDDDTYDSLGNWSEKLKNYPVENFAHLLIYKRG